MTITPEQITYLEESGTAIHESSHALAAISAGLPLEYVEIGLELHDVGVSSGRTCTTPGGSVEDRVFFSYAGIVASQIFHLAPGGGADAAGIRELLDPLDKDVADKIDKRARWRAKQFVIKHKLDIYRLASTLLVRRHLTAKEVKRIFEGTEPVKIPSMFLWAVRNLQFCRWAPRTVANTTIATAA